jgi:peptide/nickel transport system ATP-binding protein
MTALLEVEGLTVAFPGQAINAVAGLDFSLAPGERLAIVGGSGSGKSATAMALLGLLPSHARVSAGRYAFDGNHFDIGSPMSLELLRGKRIGMVFQEPMTSLNPVLSIGRQLIEALLANGMPYLESKQRAIDMLARVGIDQPHRRMQQYPHEFSGGMRQRVMIAMAMLLKPKLLIADEPTTALDVTVQAQVLDLMGNLTRETGASLLLITHDMGVVAETTDRVLVMRQGRAVETQPVATLFSAPRDIYTRQLLAAVPGADSKTRHFAGEPKPILVLDSLSKRFAGTLHPAVDGISLSLSRGETLALVGESGSGKSTLGRLVARLMVADAGSIRFSGTDITRAKGGELRRLRQRMQMVFQDPYASLNPRRTIGDSIAEPLAVRGDGRLARKARVNELLERVGLTPEWCERFPHQLSGGQRQRVVIARALAAAPSLLIADEPTSALDVSVQAEVLSLLLELQQQNDLAILFITHDLAVVRKIAHRVAIMRQGRILEQGLADIVLSDPVHPYTKALLSAAPIPDPAQRGRVRFPVPPIGAPALLRRISAQHWVAS